MSLVLEIYKRIKEDPELNNYVDPYIQFSFDRSADKIEREAFEQFGILK